ncbi:MAG: 30S ribosomal protein S21 [Pseudomonadales bacterium]|nr:30S ribosomal protein S21 [Candidatus Woesebacteria bacterium]MCB9802055.1 30S ribosomal protein S21 [Pseudomonadales bacterium]
MPIVIKASPGDSTNDVIKKYKKAVAASNVVQIARDRQYYKKPSRIRAEYKAQMSRLKKRSRSLKRMKNISPQALERIKQRLGSQ